MNKQRKNLSILKLTLSALILLIFLSLNSFATETQSSDPNKYLDAVREFADNVLKYGRDTYGPLQTPLFVDGVNVTTHEPVKWINPDGTQWVLSNFASQQTLLRTLDGLSAITGDNKYRQAAEEEIKYVFANLRTPNGLLYWSENMAYDAQADEIYTNNGRTHSFKGFYPYYELMWQVDPNVTRDFVESVWAAHIKNWSNLEMNRLSAINTLSVPKNWEQEYRGGPIYFQTTNRSFNSTGMNLCYAAVILSKFSGLEEPLTWSKRLAYRYVETRDPHTGFSGIVYTQHPIPHPLAKHFEGHAVNQGTVFYDLGGGDPNEREPFFNVLILSPGLIGNYNCRQSICEFLFSQLLGDSGREFQQWASEELTARGKVLYRSENNSWVPMLADGTSLEGFVCQEDMPGWYYDSSMAGRLNRFLGLCACLQGDWRRIHVDDG